MFPKFPKLTLNLLETSFYFQEAKNLELSNGRPQLTIIYLSPLAGKQSDEKKRIFLQNAYLLVL